MIPSREYEDVKDWLKTYPNIELVSRDGSATYRKAINDALPDAIQVSDRFHLFKNLTDYAKEYLKKEFGVRVKIPALNGAVLDSPSENKNETSNVKEHRLLVLKDKYAQIDELMASGNNKSSICKNLDIDVRTYDKLVILTPEEVEAKCITKRERNHEEKIKQKMEIVNEVRELKSQGLSERKIAKQVGLGRVTVSKYLDEKFNPSHAAYDVRKTGKLTRFEDEINSMLMKGIKGTTIVKTIREKGYSGSTQNFRHYIANWKRKRWHESYNNTENTGAIDEANSKSISAVVTNTAVETNTKEAGAVEHIERKDLMKLLYNTPDKVKSITKQQLDSVFEHYPNFLKIYASVWDFKSIFEDNDVAMLDTWLENVKSLHIAEFESFAKGINLDIAAVKNAIELPYSNGLAEGKVNKIKLIKRIMFGRCSFLLLKVKTLILEKFKRKK
jgi:predicted transcriptional regulator